MCERLARRFKDDGRDRRIEFMPLDSLAASTFRSSRPAPPLSARPPSSGSDVRARIQKRQEEERCRGVGLRAGDARCRAAQTNWGGSRGVSRSQENIKLPPAPTRGVTFLVSFFLDLVYSSSLWLNAVRGCPVGALLPFLIFPHSELPSCVGCSVSKFSVIAQWNNNEELGPTHTNIGPPFWSGPCTEADSHGRWPAHPHHRRWRTHC